MGFTFPVPGILPSDLFSRRHALNFYAFGFLGLAIASLWGIDICRRQDWKRILFVAFPLFGLCAALMIVGAFSLHVIQWAPEWTRNTALFAFGNLFFVCIPEEAFFRGFVQRKLSELWADR